MFQGVEVPFHETGVEDHALVVGVDHGVQNETVDVVQVVAFHTSLGSLGEILGWGFLFLSCYFLCVIMVFFSNIVTPETEKANL